MFEKKYVAVLNTPKGIFINPNYGYSYREPKTNKGILALTFFKLKLNSSGSINKINLAYPK